ncbi:hypothetical protein [Spiroplasma endosymbiont of Diplazon laetatorius]|uniref:hypothetical protein n=1 Tax=Spiroplasma endosymbiont of Diplazon laetatorius TaxID=3066322 RepID=UPI0030CF0A2E
MFNTLISFIGAASIIAAPILNVAETKENKVLYKKDSGNENVEYIGDEIVLYFESHPEPTILNSGNAISNNTSESLFVYSFDMGETPVWEYSLNKNNYPSSDGSVITWKWGDAYMFPENEFYEKLRWSKDYPLTDGSVEDMDFDEVVELTDILVDENWYRFESESNIKVGSAITYYYDNQNIILEFVVYFSVGVINSDKTSSFKLSLGNSLSLYKPF